MKNKRLAVTALAFSMLVSAISPVYSMQAFADEVSNQINTETNGWVTVDGNTYYVQYGSVVKHTILQIDGDYYGFDDNGVLYKNQEFSLYNNYLCFAQQDGKLLINSWNSNKTCYYGEYGGAVNGLQTIDGKLYFFRGFRIYSSAEPITLDGVTYVPNSEHEMTKVESDGWVTAADGTLYYVQDNSLTYGILQIDGYYYGFDYNGRLYTDTYFTSGSYETGDYHYYYAQSDGKLLTNSWNDTRTSYFTEDGSAAEGIQSIDGELYYFDNKNDGMSYVYTNQYICVDGKLYLASNTGTLTEVEGEGWFSVLNNTYYFTNGSLLSYCVEQIDGFYYGFDSYGVLYKNQAFMISEYDPSTGMGSSNFYYAQEDGKLLTNSWSSGTILYTDAIGVARLEGLYYFGEDGARLEGLQNIDGDNYYLAPELQKSQILSINGELYIADSTGKLLKVESDGWKTVDDNTYYIQNGKYLTGSQQIDGYTYYFNYDGKLARNAVFSIWNSSESKSYYYGTGADGKTLINSWSSDGNYYFGEEGYGLVGLQVIDGKQYYFADNGSLYKNAIVTIDGKNYTASATGELLQTDSEGWITVEGNQYYILNGAKVTGCFYQIDGNNYYFDSTGALLVNSTIINGNETYYASSTGILTKPEDVQIGTIFASGECEDGLNWSLKKSETGYELSVSGNGEMKDYDSDDPAPWSTFSYYVTEVVLAEGITTVGARAFYGYHLNKIQIPSSVTEIGDDAFLLKQGPVVVYFSGNQPEISACNFYYPASNDTNASFPLCLIHIPSTWESVPALANPNVTWIVDEHVHTWNDGEITKPATATEEGSIVYTCTECGEQKTESIPKTVAVLDEKAKIEHADCVFETSEEGQSYWYENEVRQGTYEDENGVVGDGTIRGREIYDPATNGWYWLDACYEGAKATSKEVWMPYIYQDEENWSEEEIWDNANQSDAGMAQQVHDAIVNKVGKWVRYKADGMMVKGWYTVEGDDCAIYPDQVGNTYYYDSRTGLMAKGYLTIDGITYHFDEVTGVLTE